MWAPACREKYIPYQQVNAFDHDAPLTSYCPKPLQGAGPQHCRMSCPPDILVEWMSLVAGAAVVATVLVCCHSCFHIPSDPSILSMLAPSPAGPPARLPLPTSPAQLPLPPYPPLALPAPASPPQSQPTNMPSFCSSSWLQLLHSHLHRQQLPRKPILRFRPKAQPVPIHVSN